MRATRGLLSILALLAGCNAATGDTETGDPNALTAGGTEEALCKPAPTLTKLTKPAADYYEVFPDEQSARAALEPILAANGLTLSATPAPDAAVQIVARHFAAYETLYPEHTAGMTKPPQVLIVDSTAPNAFAITDPAKDKVYPWVFIIFTGLLNAPEVVNNPGVLESTIAHELGHLILKNLFGKDNYAFYQAASVEKGQFGFAQKSDPSIAAAYKTYQAASDRVGRIYAKPLGNFPFHLGSNPDPTYVNYLKFMVQALAASGASVPAACAVSDDDASKLQAIVDKHLDKSNLTLPLGDDDAAAAVLSADWEAQTRSCFDDLNGSIADMVTQGRQALASQGAAPAVVDALLPDLDDSDKAVDAAVISTKTVNHFFALAAARRAAMAAIVESTDVPYASLRFFSEEEEADDAAVRIITRVGGKLDMLLNPYSPTFRSECQSLLASGKTPEYGGFVDAHHGLCWRFQHVTDFASTLASCKAQ
jgi:hypothetical protein